MALFNNCVGKWALSGEVWTDASGNNNNLSATTPAPVGAAGYSGTLDTAAEFTKVSSEALYITDASQTGLDVTGSMTLSCKVKLKTVNPGEYHVFVAKSNGAANYSYMIYVNDQGQVWFLASGDGSTLTIAKSAATLSVGTWYSIRCEHDNGVDLRIYIDGTLSSGADNPKAHTTGIYNGAANFSIGCNYNTGTPANFANAVIDDVAIWSRILTAGDLPELALLGDDFGAAGTLSGVLKDRAGTVINCSTYNCRVNAYTVNNQTGRPVNSTLVAAANGAWSLAAVPGVKYLVTFEREGLYTPTNETDIAGAKFMTAT